MSLIREWYLETRTQDKTIAVFKDNTVYGSPNVNRNQEAHFIVIMKMDENQNIVSFAPNVDNTDPLNDIEYSFSESVDGFYRLVSFNPAFYSTGTASNPINSIVWHSASARFYISIQENGTGTVVKEPSVTAGWESYWMIDPDFKQQLENSLVDKFIHDDIITFRFEDCLVKELDATADDILCGICTKPEDLFKTMSMQLLLAAANSNNWQDKQSRSEVIIVEGSKRFCCSK